MTNNPLFHFTSRINLVPRVSHLTALWGERGDPGLVWSRATLTIENIREGSSVIRQFVALTFVALRPTLFRIVYIRRLSKGFGKSVSRQFAVVVIMLPSYPLDLGKVGYISTVDVEQPNFIPK